MNKLQQINKKIKLYKSLNDEISSSEEQIKLY